MGSGVTNFLSVIEARSLGTADIDKMAAAIDKQSAALENLGKSANKVNEHPGFNAFAEKIKQGIQDPLGAIGDAAESALKALGPVGTGVAAAVTTFASFAAAGFEAAKSLGEYGVQLQNVALRTGLSTKEVSQFSFAAKIAGQDVSVFETAMRKLSQGLDDNSVEGEKARKGLADLGVVSRDATGALRPMSDIFIQISSGLNRISEPAIRNTEALRLFGRAGIELLPTLVGLSENVKRAKELGLGATEEDLHRWEKYQKNVVEATVLWDQFTRKIKEPLAATITFLFKDSSGHQYSLAELAERGVNLGRYAPRTQFADQQAAKAAGFGAGADWATAGRMDDALGYTNRIEDRNRTDAAIATTLGNQNLDQRLRAAQQELSGLSLTKGSSSMADVEAYRAAQQRVADLQAQVEAAKQAAVDLAAAVKVAIAAVEAQTKLDNDNTTKLLNGGQQLYHAQFGGLPEWVAREVLGYESGAIGPMLSGAVMFRRPSEDQQAQGLMDWYKTIQENEEGAGKRELRDARDNERRGLGLFGARASLSGVSEIDQTTALASLRKQYADAEYEAARKVADAKNDEQAKQDAIDQQHQKYLDAEIERQQALYQLALRQKEEFQNLVVGGVEALIHGNGASFLKSTGTGILDKVVGNAAGLGYSSISKYIPHASGTAGKLLGGTMFGPDPLKASTDANTLATADNTTALRAMAVGSGAGSGGWGTSSALSTFSKFNPFSAANNNGIEGGMPDGYVQPSVAGMNTVSGFEDMNNNPIGPGAVVPRTGLGWGAGVGIAGAAVAGGFGAYSGFKAGGAQGALTGTGSLAAAGGAIAMLAGASGPLAPILLGVGLALPLISTLLGDPKKNRAGELATQQQERSYTMPTGVDYSLDASGRYADYNYRGQVRTTVVNNVYAMDSKSFNDYLMENPDALSNGITSALAGGNGDDIVSTIAARMPA